MCWINLSGRSSLFMASLHLFKTPSDYERNGQLGEYSCTDTFQDDSVRDLVNFHWQRGVACGLRTTRRSIRSDVWRPWCWQHHRERMYVRCLLIDFSKAFDSFDHLIVINKLKALNIADNIIQWVVSFLTDMNQFVKVCERWSFTKVINRSIIQGSGLGSTLFTIRIIDLQLIGSSNRITKYWRLQLVGIWEVWYWYVGQI